MRINFGHRDVSGYIKVDHILQIITRTGLVDNWVNKGLTNMNVQFQSDVFISF